MSLSRDEYVQNAALHEAAHALAFSEGGLAVYSIRVHDPDDPRCGGAVLVDEMDVETDDQHEALLHGSLTGCVASAMFLMEVLDWPPEQAWDYAEDCSTSDLAAFEKEAGEPPQQADFDSAEEWVNEHWGALVELAEGLLDAGGVVTAASVL